MLFRPFRVVYTVKELDSHAKHGQSFQKRFGSMTEYFCGKKSSFWVRTSFGKFFSIMALADVNDGGTPYMGISPGRTRPCTHRPERERERTHQCASFGCTARDSLGKNVSKEVCFWLCWICTSFDTERWSGLSYKRSRSWFRTADSKWNGIKCLRFVRDRRKCSSLFSSAHSAPPGARLFFGENRKAVSFFYKYDKTKDFLEIWRMQYYSIGTQD